MTAEKKPMDALGKLQQFRAERSENNVLHLVFDMPGRPMNVFSNAAISELAIFSRWLRDSDVKGVVIPSVKGGVVAGVILGLGRALGEAIAVTQVIGNFIPLKLSLFASGDTIASRVANQYQGATSNLQIASLIYLALILLVITFLTNVGAQIVIKRFEFQRNN